MLLGNLEDLIFHKAPSPVGQSFSFFFLLKESFIQDLIGLLFYL